MGPNAVLGLLAEESRLRAFAAVVLGARTPGEVALRADLSAREAVAAINRLLQGGLLTSVDGGLVAQVTLFKDTVREYAAAQNATPAEPLDPDRDRAAVLRAFIADGRLVSIPAARGKRRIILEHIVSGFEPGVKYPEREVDAVLRAWHPDYPALRRHLIDEDLMSRADGVYWRTGGPVLPR
ncbi:DUF2087 domain-containing protein [Luedemannella flava]|uniref:DUF2087 domain-containing protein n=1 Tax=Luedemannella flava TaxID=349316 RepID=A0ABN2MKW5_9ACTN